MALVMALAAGGCADSPAPPESKSPPRPAAAEPPADAARAAAPAAAIDYRGDKPWNRNPELPRNNPAYKKQGQRVDMIGANGLLFVDEAGPNQFVDWPPPKVALVLSGALAGYIEPCGCTGLENMKGGLSRRHTLLKQLAADGWKLVKLDLGGQVGHAGPQAVIKYQRTIDGLRTMGYQAIGFGPADLRLPAADLVATVSGDEPTHFVSANVSLLGADNQYTVPWRVVREGGVKIGVTAVTGAPRGKAPHSEDATLLDPVEALKKVLPKLQAQHCDKLVLLANTTRDEARALARQFPKFDLVVCYDDGGDPPRELVRVDGTSAQVVELTHKGMYAGVVALFDDAARPVRYQRVPLDARFPDSPEMKRLMVQYQEQLREEGLERLGVRPIPHPKAGSTFVGSKTCGGCHTEAFAVWKKTPHAHALETLERVVPPRQFDPECLSCHVTGWDPQPYRPFVSGFESRKQSPLLAGNGCENCHGPGSQHAAVESGKVEANEARHKELQQGMRVSLAEAKRSDCARCHDQDNSPDFQGGVAFDKFWPKIEHRGKD